MPMRVSQIVLLLALAGCSIEVPPSPEIPDAVDLHGTQISLTGEESLPSDSIGLETFGCDGEWAGQGRLGYSGTYRIDGGQVCVTMQRDVTTETCRAFHFEAPGELYLRYPNMDAWIEYRAFDHGEC